MTEKLNIKNALNSFDNDNLYTSGIALLNAIDYESERTIELSQKNLQGLMQDLNIPDDAFNRENLLYSLCRLVYLTDSNAAQT